MTGLQLDHDTVDRIGSWLKYGGIASMFGYSAWLFHVGRPDEAGQLLTAAIVAGGFASKLTASKMRQETMQADLDDIRANPNMPGTPKTLPPPGGATAAPPGP